MTDVCRAVALLPGSEKVVGWTGQDVQVLAAVDGVLPVPPGFGREGSDGGGKVRGGGARLVEGAKVTEEGDEREDKGGTPAEIPLDCNAVRWWRTRSRTGIISIRREGDVAHFEQARPLLVVWVHTVGVSVLGVMDGDLKEVSAVRAEKAEKVGKVGGPTVNRRLPFTTPLSLSLRSL